MSAVMVFGVEMRFCRLMVDTPSLMERLMMAVAVVARCSCGLVNTYKYWVVLGIFFFFSLLEYM